MKTIILDSRKGSQLDSFTTNNPKCLIEISKGETILSRQLDLLFSLGCDDIIIITGYFADKVEEYVKSKYSGKKVKFVYNEFYDFTNNIYSLNQLRNIEFNEDVLILHGDLVFEKSVLENAVNTTISSLVVDSTLPVKKRDCKVLIEHGLVSKIGINLYYENSIVCEPIYHLKNSDWKKWQEEIEKFCYEGKTTFNCENALNKLTNQIKLFPLDKKGKFCMKIYDEEDLKKARNIFI